MELDALRGIGAITILGFHIRPGAFFFGWTRVDLFFVISGFVISRIIFRHGERSGFLLTFWARRALRVWPSYYLLLVILILLAASRGQALPLDGLIAHATFTQNLPYYWSTRVAAFPHAALQTWSLAIEEQYYLVWPIAAVLAGRWVLVPLSAWLIANSVVLRLDGIYPAVALARADGLALGTILAWLLNQPFEGSFFLGAHPRRAVQRYGPVLEEERSDATPFVELPSQIANEGGNPSQRHRGFSVVFAISAVVGIVSLLGPFPKYEEPIPGVSGCGPWSILAVNLLYFSLVGAVVLNSGHRLLAPLRWRPLGYLGQISLGIYLYNLLAIEAAHRLFGLGSALADLTAVFLSLLAGAASWELLERPLGDLKRWLPYATDHTELTGSNAPAIPGPSGKGVA